MRYRQVTVVAILVAASAVTLSAQFGGDPLTGASQRFMTIIVQAVRYMGVAAIAIGGLRYMFGRGDSEYMAQVAFGGAIAFGASYFASALFPGLTP